MNGGNKPLKYALLYGEAGYLVFPCRPGTKMPATRHGLHDASAEPGEIAAMFTDPEANIGLACGPQPNDINLLAIDIDAHKGGSESWHYLTRDLSVVAPQHDTPSGGRHLFFDAPSEFRNSRERLGAGIDTRASGGYVIVPPSSLFPVDGGADRPYHATGATALLTNVPPLVPDWLLELLEPQVDLQDDAERGPVSRSEPREEWESPADWIRRVGDWPTELARFGWAHAHGEYWVRPGKDPRDGHSAVLHDGGPLVVFSTDVPRELEALGKVTADGASFAISLFDFITAYEFGGDRSASAREFRRLMPTAGSGYGQGPLPTVGGAPVSTAGSEPRVVTLPPEFWEARPILSQVRQAAQCRRVAPEAMLAHALVRSATLIPPSLRLPALIGGLATFDFLACVVGKSGTGKSGAQLAAKDLLPDRDLMSPPGDRTIMFDRPAGSGEGVVQAFQVPEMTPDDNGTLKRTGKQVVGKQALHLIVDEGVAFSEMSKRQGATIVPTLLSAWSGATLGQQNAAAETNRFIEGGTVRVTAMLHIQPENANKLFTDELTTLGFTSRVLFVPGLDSSAPDVKPPWPGPITFPVPATIDRKTYITESMTYDEAIMAEIDAAHLAVLRGEIDNVVRGHTSLLRCKVASILAVWEGRRNVTIDDWALAGQVTELSSDWVQVLKDQHARQERDRSHRAAEGRGIAEAVAESAKKSKQITDMALNLVGRVPPEGIGRAELRRQYKSTSRKYFDDALDQARSEGRVRLTNGRVELVS